MKVYMNSLASSCGNLNTINLNTINLIKKYLTKRTTLNYIYSSKGIYQVHKNKLMRLEIVDINYKKKR